MRNTAVAVVLSLLIASNPILSGAAQQVPFLPELLSHYGRFNRLYMEKLRSGANLTSMGPLRQQIETAFRGGNIRGMLDYLNQGIAVLEGKPWDERQRFISSLSLEVDRVVVEPNNEVRVSLVRMFLTNVERVFPSTPRVTFELTPDAASGEQAEPSAGLISQKKTAPIFFGERIPISQESTNASRRLRISDGAYLVLAKVEVDGQIVAELSKSLFAISDFTDRIDHLSGVVSVIKNSVDPKIKAVARQIITPEFQLRRLAQLSKSESDYSIDVLDEMERIQYVLGALARGENPFAAERGELERAYMGADGSLIPYRVYVPTSYDGTTARPLAILLHGALGDESTYFGGLYDRTIIIGESERRGVILVSPNAGGRFPTYRGASQDDVLGVFNEVTRDYKVDPSRVYLSGHSLGAIGVWLVAAAKPDLFAAIAPVSGGTPAQGETLATLLGRLKGIPALVVHGSRDGIAPPALSKEIAAAAEKAGVKTSYLDIPDADHMNVVGLTFPAVMQFFETNAKSRGPK